MQKKSVYPLGEPHAVHRQQVLGDGLPRVPAALAHPQPWQPEGYTAAAVANIKAHVSATDVQAGQFRNSVGLLQDTADSVYVVSDETLCRRGALALAIYKSNPDTVNLHPILLIKAGRARFVLDDLATKGGEFMASYVADTSFNILGGMVH